MSRNKLPALNLPRPPSSESNDDLSSNRSVSARQRRRARLHSQTKLTNDVENDGQLNQGFESDDAAKNNQETTTKNPSRTRRARKSIAKEIKTEEKNQDSHPPLPKKVKKTRKTNFVSNPGYLDGLEEDIIEMSDEKKELNTDQFASDLSQRELISDNLFKSVPTDKFFLEVEKKFAIQKKELYEKKQNERLAQLFQDQLKLKQKEELKYEISTGRTALYTHKILRLFFLFFHGLNVGLQFWQTIVVYVLNIIDFKFIPNLNILSSDLFDTNDFKLMILFESISMPLHCLSYFFLTICIVDTMDRVDFTKMNCKYLVKCLSFQNQFWAIVFYMIAVLISLSTIFIDESAYLVSLNQSSILNNTQSSFLQNINNHTTAWKSVSIVKAVFSLLGWLLFSIFVKDDKTYESLEKRDFTVLDDIANDLANQNQTKA